MTKDSFLAADQAGWKYKIKVRPLPPLRTERAGFREEVGQEEYLTEDGDKVERIELGRYLIHTKSGETISVVACDADAR